MGAGACYTAHRYRYFARPQFSWLEIFISQIGIVGHNYRSQKFCEIKRRIWGGPFESGVAVPGYILTQFSETFILWDFEVPGKFTLFFQSYVWLLLFSRREFEKIDRLSFSGLPLDV